MKVVETAVKDSLLKPSREDRLDLEECKEEEDYEDPLSDPAKAKTESHVDRSIESNESMSKETITSGSKQNGLSNGEESKKEGPRRKKNKDFEDFNKTGRWGSISNFEIFLVTFFMVLIAVSVTVAVVVFVDGNEASSTDETNAATASVKKPTHILTPEAQMELIRSKLEKHPLLNGVLDDYEGDANNPFRSAATWVVEEDHLDQEDDILPRFGLAALYYATGGPSWNQQEGWLTSVPICDGWYGVTCDLDGNMIELELRGNNLTGEIPLTLILLDHLEILWIDDNSLRGPLRSDLFADMSALQILYIQNNQLTGPIPDTFLDGKSQLASFYIHGNLFTGSFPDRYCPACADCPHPLYAFGIDCKKNPCPEGCCKKELNCFL